MNRALVLRLQAAWYVLRARELYIRLCDRYGAPLLALLAAVFLTAGIVGRPAWFIIAAINFTGAVVTAALEEPGVPRETS